MQCYFRNEQKQKFWSDSGVFLSFCSRNVLLYTHLPLGLKFCPYPWCFTYTESRETPVLYWFWLFIKNCGDLALSMRLYISGGQAWHYYNLSSSSIYWPTVFKNHVRSSFNPTLKLWGLHMTYRAKSHLSVRSSPASVYLPILTITYLFQIPLLLPCKITCIFLTNHIWIFNSSDLLFFVCWKCQFLYHLTSIAWLAPPLISSLISAHAIKSKSKGIVIICCSLVFLMTLDSMRVGTMSLCSKLRAWHLMSLFSEATLLINVCLLHKPSFPVQLFQLIVFILLQKNSSYLSNIEDRMGVISA